MKRAWLLLLTIACETPESPRPPAAPAPPPPAAGAPVSTAPPAATAAAPEEPMPNPWVVPSGRDAAVLALLAPIRDGGEIVAGWKLARVSVDRERIDIHAEGTGPAVTVTLIHAEAAGDARAVTKSFKIRASAESGVPAEAVVAKIVERVTANDRGDLWVRAADAPTAP